MKQVTGYRLQVAGYRRHPRVTRHASRSSQERFAFHASRSSRGFTLLELIIVMLASLAIGMGALLVVNTLPSARFGATGREISAAIRQMTILAQNKGEDQILMINLDTHQYGPEGRPMKTFPANISVMVNDPIVGEVRYGKYPILFRASGGVEGGTVVLGYRKKVLFIQDGPCGRVGGDTTMIPITGTGNAKQPGVNRHRLSAEQGFTLLEVLVGLAIMGIAVVVLFQIFSANLRAIGASEDYVSATVRAEARMREISDSDKLAETAWSEVTPEGYRVDIVIAETLNQRTELLPVRLLGVALTIHWKRGLKDKSMTLRTVKMIGRQT